MRASAQDVRPLRLLRSSDAALDLAAFKPASAKLANGLRDLLARFALTATVNVGELVRVEAGTDADCVAIPIRLPELNCEAVLALPKALAVVLVDRLYGGTATVRPLNRALTAGEQRTALGFAGQFVPILASALAPLVRVTPQVILDDGSQPAKPSYAQKFCVDTEAGKSVIDLVLPETALQAMLGSSPSGVRAADAGWASRLTEAVLQAHLPVRTILARPELPLERLLRLAPGDVIPVRLPALVPVSAAGRLIGHGSIGDANGRAAVKLETMEQGFAA